MRNRMDNTERFVSYGKLSKKVRRERDRQKRVAWEICPVSRVKESKKVYNRKRISVFE